jgi:lysine biosynthesis protein LysW
MARVFCPQCSHRVKLRSRPVESQLVQCQHCKTVLEIVSLEPVELDWAYFEPAEEEKDWEPEEERVVEPHP